MGLGPLQPGGGCCCGPPWLYISSTAGINNSTGRVYQEALTVFTQNTNCLFRTAAPVSAAQYFSYNGYAGDVDADLTNEYLFTVYDGKLYRSSSIDGSGATAILSSTAGSLGAAGFYLDGEGVAVDSVNENVYVTAAGEQYASYQTFYIYRCDYNGNSPTAVITIQVVNYSFSYNPIAGLSVDPSASLLFWSAGGYNDYSQSYSTPFGTRYVPVSGIFSSDLSGGGQTELINGVSTGSATYGGTTYPTYTVNEWFLALDVDFTSQTVFFSDIGASSYLSSIPYAGASSATQILTPAGGFIQFLCTAQTPGWVIWQSLSGAITAASYAGSLTAYTSSTSCQGLTVGAP